MIEKILHSIKKLPAFPMTIQRVIEIMRNDDYSVHEVANIIKYDQAIVANILKISNSAYFGPRQRIKTIPDAVVYLGQKQLIRAVQTAGVSRYFTKEAKGYGTKAKDLWQHSIAVALLSQILSRRLFNQEDGALYTAALVHDIGKLIMGAYVQESAEKIFRLVSEEGLSFLEAEEKIIGINHAELGGRIADHWNFPPEIRKAIAYHHRPDLLEQNDDDDSMPSLVFLADQYCLMIGIDGGMDGLAHRGDSGVLKKYRLREVNLEEDLVLLYEELKKANDLIQIV
jgi:putative nucleotidyltransferase with HDIG domain